jgi:acyl carrier protein
LTADATYARLTEILRDLFDDDSLTATPELTADQVFGWDSFAQLRLIFAVEAAFGVSFAASEVTNLPNVGALADLIIAKSSR